MLKNMLIEKKFDGKTYYGGMLRSHSTKEGAKDTIKKLFVRNAFSYRIVKENGKYEIYVRQRM